ncbi:hypothetical protein EJ110_NYTH38148 [Nymphaea thermarum]|nr:hypothetical protein EJ110_NYTH38148 [Nymphaea thermarum]
MHLSPPISRDKGFVVLTISILDTDTCLILAPSRTAEGLAESSRVEPTSGMSSSWARRLPLDRLMSLLSGEVSLGRESHEQQAAAWRPAKDGRKPKE